MRALKTAIARALVVAAACACAALMLPDAPAAQQTPTCLLDAASVMSFGSYDPTSETPLDVQGRVSYRCDQNATRTSVSSRGRTAPGPTGGPLMVQISLSTGNAGRFDRHMQGTHDRLRYNLFLDAQHSTIWGDGTGGTQAYISQAQPNGKVVVVPVFGRLFPAQDVSGGVYLDNIIVTLNF